MALVIGKKQAANGIDSQWREYTDKDGKVLAKVQIRGNGYKPYQQAIDRIARYGAKLDRLVSGGLTADVLNAADENSLSEMEAHCLIVAQHLIVDWSGIEDENGDAVPYSVEAADTLLQQNAGLWVWLIGQAKNIQLSANAQVDETVKKQLPDTTGSSKAKGRKKQSSSASA